MRAGANLKRCKCATVAELVDAQDLESFSGRAHP